MVPCVCGIPAAQQQHSIPKIDKPLSGSIYTAEQLRSTLLDVGAAVSVCLDAGWPDVKSLHCHLVATLQNCTILDIIKLETTIMINTSAKHFDDEPELMMEMLKLF